MATLVTGGAGFIGHHLSRRLLEEGRDIVIVDDLNDTGVGGEEKVDNMWNLTDDFRDLGVEFPNDIRDTAELRRIILEYEVDSVVHLAALAGVRPSKDHPTEYASVNLAGTTSVLEASRDVVDNFVFASSSSVYGDRDGEFREDDELRPESFYGLTKKLDEDIARFFSEHYGLNTTGLRFFTVYGPRSRKDMAHRIFADKIINNKVSVLNDNGNGVRDYTYVSDIVNGIVLALDQPRRCEVYNLGGGEPVSTKDLFYEMAERLGVDKFGMRLEDHKEGDVHFTCADTTKAELDLGFIREIGFEDGLDLYCEWVKEHYSS